MKRPSGEKGMVQRSVAIALLGLLVVCLGCASQHVGGATKEVRPLSIVGYLPEWRMEGFVPATARYLTDIIFFSIEPKPSGDLDTERARPGHLELLQAVKRESSVRVLVSVGGWGRSAGFAQMATNGVTRGRFVQAIAEYCRENGLDGVDYDWEFPENRQEKEAYSQLIVETKKVLSADGGLVTVALSPFQYLDADAYEALDRIHVMAYDQRPQHSTMAQAQAAVRKFMRAGVPLHKICLGLPFYGRKVDQWDAVSVYADIVRDYAPAPQTNEAGGFYFNGIDMVRDKTRFARDNKLAGIMIWEIGQDTGDNTSLLRAIHEEASKPGKHHFEYEGR